MAGTSVSSIYKLLMKVSGDQQGNSETLWLPQTSLSAALAAAKGIADWRLKILPSSMSLDWCQVIKAGGDRDGHAVYNSYPRPGQWAPTGGDSDTSLIAPNLISDAIYYRVETEDGPWSTPHVHGVPDKNVVADALTSGTFTIPDTDPGIAADQTDWLAGLGKYLRVIWARCVFYKRTVSVDGSGNPVITQTTFPIFNVIVRKVATKKVGLPFGLQRGRSRPR